MIITKSVYLFIGFSMCIISPRNIFKIQMESNINILFKIEITNAQSINDLFISLIAHG